MKKNVYKSEEELSLYTFCGSTYTYVYTIHKATKISTILCAKKKRLREKEIPNYFSTNYRTMSAKDETTFVKRVHENKIFSTLSSHSFVSR